jgi:hypothetical protein
MPYESQTAKFNRPHLGNPCPPMVVKNSPFGAYIATEEGSSKGLGQSSAAKAFKGDNQTDGEGTRH